MSFNLFTVLGFACSALIALDLPGVHGAISYARGFSDTSRFGPPYRHNYTLETVTGFFLQDLNSTNQDTFDASINFGLVSNAPLNWKSFEWSISELNRRAPRDVSYRVLYMARHGEGFHNLAESTYGTPAWNTYWSLIDGDGHLTWGPDALLTPLGVQQALNLSGEVKTQAAQGMPLPQTFYVSPLTRSTDTLNLTFGDWLLGKDERPEPVIIEGLRETIGVHTCDNRRSKTFIHNRYPTWMFEKGFAEKDPLWTPNHRETNAQQQARARQALVEIFNRDDSTYIWITSHSGETASLLGAIGHRQFSLGTGRLIPTVVKVTRIPASEEPMVNPVPPS